MDHNEKKRRCLAAEQRSTGEDTMPACRVYTRWVMDCADCAFSYLARPSLGIDETCLINETVDKCIRCHELRSASACDGACYKCEFSISETQQRALEKLHRYAMENML